MTVAAAAAVHQLLAPLAFVGDDGGAGFAIRVAFGVSAVWLAAGAAALVLRWRSSAALRHRLWSLATLAALALPALAALLPAWRVGAVRLPAAAESAPAAAALAAP